MSELSQRLQTLAPIHREALEWFNSRRDELIGWPEPLNGLFLVNKAKGIQKPQGWEHSLSVRQSLNSPYADRMPEHSSDGSWTYDYYQEGSDPADRDKHATNRGLMACMRDNVPVAVLLQRKGKPGVRYQVLGLAKVEGWSNGYFNLRGYSADGRIAAITADDELPVHPPSYANAAEPTQPISVEDARKKVLAEIVARQGGGVFRRTALKGFGGRCAISGCDVAPVLEAAHIVPYKGIHTNSLDNTLLLRSDLHTLFDRDLLTIDPISLEVKFAEFLAEGRYAEEFGGVRVSPPNGVSAPTLSARLSERTALGLNAKGEALPDVDSA